MLGDAEIETAKASSISQGITEPEDLDTALAKSELSETHRRPMGFATDGILDWRTFDITDFGTLMPNLAVLDYLGGGADGPDFIYGFVGESINYIARQTLRGQRLSQALTGIARERIIAEYVACIDGRAVRASSGQVVISDLHWFRYRRFLYPMRTASGVDRVVLVMVFFKPD